MTKDVHQHHHVGQKVYLHHQAMDTKNDHEESVMLLPSASQILIDDGCQASSDSILEETERAENTHLALIVAPKRGRRKAARSCFPAFVDKPPELIRGFILNKGESYWQTCVNAVVILGTTSIIQVIVYFLVFGLMGHYRIIIALLPIRVTVIQWFLVMFGLDITVMLIIKIGQCISTKFELGKRVDLYLIIVSTILLIIAFLISAAYPIYATPYLRTTVRGTIITNYTYCMPARDSFMQAGTDWDAIPELRKICDKHILCVENCRDFRSMYVWFYGTYILTVIRLFVLLFLWDIGSFLCMVVDIREENITYTVNLGAKGYHV